MTRKLKKLVSRLFFSVGSSEPSGERVTFRHIKSSVTAWKQLDYPSMKK